MGKGETARMGSGCLGVVAGLCIVVLIAGVSLAKNKNKNKEKDYCISFPGHAIFELVGKGFSIPDPGTCQPWTGFFLHNDNSASPSAGTGCTATDGSDLALTITSSGATGSVTIEAITLSLPAQTGSDVEKSIGVFGEGTDPNLVLPAAGAPCSNVAIPAASPPPVGPQALVLEAPYRNHFA